MRIKRACYFHTMCTYDSFDKLFVDHLTEYVHLNLEKEHFSIDELSKHLGLSRSTIHRKLKLMKKESLSQFIRELRLKRAFEMLEEKIGTVSEIAYKVGFSSPAYFNKCFHEYFGFAPGEVKRGSPHKLENKENGTELAAININKHSKRRPFLARILRLKTKILFIHAGLIWLLIIGLIIYFTYIAGRTENYGISFSMHPKTVLLVPFKNLSDNISFQNLADGIADDLRDFLSKSTHLKILSKNSSLQIAVGNLSTRQISRKLDADYMLEGSIRSDSVDTKISIQLTDIKLDRQIWAEPFEIHKNKNILMEQTSIAKHIASDIEQIICYPETTKK